MVVHDPQIAIVSLPSAFLVQLISPRKWCAQAMPAIGWSFPADITGSVTRPHAYGATDAVRLSVVWAADQCGSL